MYPYPSIHLETVNGLINHLGEFTLSTHSVPILQALVSKRLFGVFIDKEVVQVKNLSPNWLITLACLSKFITEVSLTTSFQNL